MGKIKMVFTGKLLQIFGQKCYTNVSYFSFLSAKYILADLAHMTRIGARPIQGV